MAVSDQIKNTIGRALGRMPSGEYILTSQGAAGPVAMLASWAQQAGFEPPAVSVAVARGRPMGAAIRSSGKMALSILAQADTTLMRHFARGTDDALSAVKLLDRPTGAPVLAEALAYLDCALLSVCDFGGDHEIFIARVEGGDLLREGPAFTHQRGNGFHY